MKENHIKYDINEIIDAYYSLRPKQDITEQQVVFGTSGHRGKSLTSSFNRCHILAICQSICDYRVKFNTTGPIFVGIDTHALSIPARDTALEVFTANGLTVIFEGKNNYTATPVISHAIIAHNKSSSKLADGIILTPSHNPPEYGGIKYNPTHGGGADILTTQWIQQRSNFYIKNGTDKIKIKSYTAAIADKQIIQKDLLGDYISSIDQVLNMNIIRDAELSIAVDPLGGASIDFWRRVADYYKLNIKSICNKIAADFEFIPKDKDNIIRMDCSSPWVMSKMLQQSKKYDLSFGNDTDADRHAVISPKTGLLHTNDFISIVVDYLHKTRKNWPATSSVGKTIVTSSLVTAVAKKNNRTIYESPVGCKWFASLLYNGTMTFGGEESAGGTFLKQDATPWCTDKDGMLMNLLAAEIVANTGKDLQDYRMKLENEHGIFKSMREDISFDHATAKEKFSKIDFRAIELKELGNATVDSYLTKATANDQPIGGIKWITKSGWVAIRASGTEPLYKIYAESFIDTQHAAGMIKEVKDLIATQLQ